MPPKIDWYYHRNGCITCGRSQAFLEKLKAQISEQVDARKNRISPTDARKLARAMSELVVARGKKVVSLNLKRDAPSDAELDKLLVGPSGNLRAPAIRRGKTLYIGFNEDEFEKRFG